MLSSMCCFLVWTAVDDERKTLPAVMAVSGMYFLQGPSDRFSLQAMHVRYRWQCKTWELAITTAPAVCMVGIRADQRMEGSALPADMAHSVSQAAEGGCYNGAL